MTGRERRLAPTSFRSSIPTKSSSATRARSMSFARSIRTWTPMATACPIGWNSLPERIRITVTPCCGSQAWRMATNSWSGTACPTSISGPWDGELKLSYASPQPDHPRQRPFHLLFRRFPGRGQQVLPDSSRAVIGKVQIPRVLLLLCLAFSFAGSYQCSAVLANCWHIPDNTNDLGFNMRNPEFELGPGSTITIYSGLQKYSNSFGTAN